MSTKTRTQRTQVGKMKHRFYPSVLAVVSLASVTFIAFLRIFAFVLLLHPDLLSAE